MAYALNTGLFLSMLFAAGGFINAGMPCVGSTLLGAAAVYLFRDWSR